MKQAREQELKYLRELGVYGKVDERADVAKYCVTPIDTKWVDTDEAFEGKPMQIRSRIVAREFNSGDRPDLYAGTPPLEALKAIIFTVASHSPEFSLMHVDVSRAYSHAKAQRPVLVKLPAEDCSGKDVGKIGRLKKSKYGTRDIVSNWERDHLESWGYELGRSSRNLFHNRKKKTSGLTHGEGTKGGLLELKNQLESVYPINASIIGAGSAKSIKVLNRRIRWGKTGILYQHDPRHVDVLIKSLGFENGNTVQSPIIDYVKDENPVWFGLRTGQQAQISCGQMIVSQSNRADNIRRERIVPENVRSFRTQLSQIETTRSVLEGRDPSFRIRGHEFRSDGFFRLRLGWRQKCGNRQVRWSHSWDDTI